MFCCLYYVLRGFTYEISWVSNLIEFIFPVLLLIMDVGNCKKHSVRNKSSAWSCDSCGSLLGQAEKRTKFKLQALPGTMAVNRMFNITYHVQIAMRLEYSRYHRRLQPFHAQCIAHLQVWILGS